MKPENQDNRVSIILDLTNRLKAKGSWCGETHIQKAAFILHSCGVPQLDYDFILYKHGPYSFELHNELAMIRDANLISLVVLQDRYGPSYEVTELWGTRFLDKNRKNVDLAKKQIAFVVEWIGDRDVKALERISTALMIAKENPEASIDSRSQTLNKIKPHISLIDAESATKQVDMKLHEAQKLNILRN